MPAKTAKTPLDVAIATATKFYRETIRRNPNGFPFSPAKATEAAAAASGIPKSRLIGTVAAVYYRENGERAPLAGIRIAKASGRPTAASAAKAVAKARNAGGRLGRWEVLAYRYAAAVSAATGAPERVPSVDAIRELAVAGGIVLEASYTGRGTRAGAKATRTDETAELALDSSE
jgi:hypothetical protein